MQYDQLTLMALIHQAQAQEDLQAAQKNVDGLLAASKLRREFQKLLKDQHGIDYVELTRQASKIVLLHMLFELPRIEREMDEQETNRVLDEVEQLNEDIQAAMDANDSIPFLPDEDVIEGHVDLADEKDVSLIEECTCCDHHG